MMTVWAVLGGFVLDALFGDPAWLPHPVVYMGKAISNKAFDSYEQGLIRDVIAARIPAQLTAAKLFS